MVRKATSLNDFVDAPEKLEFPKEHMKEFMEKIERVFGSFDRKGLHKFYAEAGIAFIVDRVKRQDGSFEMYPNGKIQTAYQYPEMKGNKIWKNYTLQSEFPLLFWEELYNQTNTWLSKREYAQQQQLLQYDDLADQMSINEKDYE